MAYGREPQVMGWDTEHFGFSIASFGPKAMSDIGPALQFARSQKVKLLMARCEVDKGPVVQALQKNGFVLMDTLVRYEFIFGNKEIPADVGQVPVRPVRPDDVEAVGQIAKAAFEGYSDYFHNHRRLDRRKCDELYMKWAINSCRDKAIADEVFVADDCGAIVGFITAKKLNAEAGDGVLACVGPEAQGKGIYRSFILQVMRWCQEQGLKRMELGPMVNNFAVQRVWQRLGWEIYAATHTFHLWLDDSGEGRNNGK